VVAAARAARDVGAVTIAVVCAPGSELAAVADHEVLAVVGPEVVAGSTRMKAGTAQKLILNTISTVAMIRIGKTFGDLMVDVIPSNAKLRGRARRVVELATGEPAGRVDEALAAADGEVKVAIVSLLAGTDAATARTRLAEAGGAVRKALQLP
jgi:N-acetylmuramic acid 6-phosphate etherase